MAGFGRSSLKALSARFSRRSASSFRTATPDNFVQIVEATGAELLIFEYEGHGMASLPNQVISNRRILEFLGAKLGYPAVPWSTWSRAVDATSR